MHFIVGYLSYALWPQYRQPLWQRHREGIKSNPPAKTLGESPAGGTHHECIAQGTNISKDVAFFSLLAVCSCWLLIFILLLKAASPVPG